MCYAGRAQGLVVLDKGNRGTVELATKVNTLILRGPESVDGTVKTGKVADSAVRSRTSCHGAGQSTAAQQVTVLLHDHRKGNGVAAAAHLEIGGEGALAGPVDGVLHYALLAVVARGAGMAVLGVTTL